MHKGIAIKRSRRQHAAAVAFLCQGKSEGIRAWAFDVRYPWASPSLKHVNSVQLLLLGLPTSSKAQSYKGFTFISCLEFLLGAAAGKHRTSTVKGAIRDTFRRGRIPSKGAGGAARWHKTKWYLTEVKMSGSWNQTKSPVLNEWNLLW